MWGNGLTAVPWMEGSKYHRRLMTPLPDVTWLCSLLQWWRSPKHRSSFVMVPSRHGLRYCSFHNQTTLFHHSIGARSGAVCAAYTAPALTQASYAWGVTTTRKIGSAVKGHVQYILSFTSTGTSHILKTYSHVWKTMCYYLSPQPAPLTCEDLLYVKGHVLYANRHLLHVKT